MSVVVLDASVVVKWLYPDRDGEADLPRATSLFERVREGQVRVVQPVHWLAEVAAVVTRLSPSTANRDVLALYALELDTEGGFEEYERAVDLARSLSHHLFDTLYHGVALVTPGATLVTADERYHAKACRHGSITLLRRWEAA